MDRLRIIGGNPLVGRVHISGAKNATLPLMASCLLTDQPLILNNFPDLADVRLMISLLAQLGVQVSAINSNVANNTKSSITLQAQHIHSTATPYELVSKMRASVLVLGPLIARKHHACVSLPGGCAIGVRPIDFHLKGLESMGAKIHLREGDVIASAPEGLVGSDYYFPVVSVTGTENLLMAATLAKGTTRLFNAAIEPEVTDLAECLIAMGADIEGIGTRTLIIHGVEGLNGASYSIIPDRIETGTYAIAAAITGGELELVDTKLCLIPTIVDIMQGIGIKFEPLVNGFKVKLESSYIHPQNVVTRPYPFFPTDLQAQFMALMTLARGSSIITETIWENRFMHVAELIRMGANISIKGNCAHVIGVDHLIGAQVMATDLRASVSLVLAGLAAQGETVINRIYHLDRGYENIEAKLTACGAKIERITDR